VDTAETIIFVSIFALAALLIALPRMLNRRERRGREAAAADNLESPDPESPDPERIDQGSSGSVPADHAEPVASGVTEAPDADVPGRRRLRDRLGKSRAPFAGMRGRLKARQLDDAAWDDLEETLLLADVGVPTTARLLDGVRGRAQAAGLSEADGLPALLRVEIAEQLDRRGDRTLALDAGRPNAWLLVGVNGVGKTTTAAKLATRELARGHTVLLAAADTFRAAAADQLLAWGTRIGVDVIRGQEGGDPGAVAFDAVQAAGARGIDLVLVDTAGRLHTKVNLMEELKKIGRVVERTPGALREVLLVLDATTGQNGLAQAREFAEAVGVTGVVLTKLDGSAKGGVVLAIEAELGVPVKLVGVGEMADDLVDFDPAEFAAALVG
jgi:fused signal recognition particle receptor